MRVRARPLLLLALLLGAWALAVDVHWIARDRLLRDGDEEGHVGAAELFAADLREGRPGRFLRRLLWEDMGDYPSAWPAALGLWWWAAGSGPPERPAVRIAPLLALATCGAATAAGAALLGPARRSAPERRAAVLLAGAAVLQLPLAAGLARHFMPETALAAATALAVAAAAWHRRRPAAVPALLLGLALGLGLLTKQTFPLVALPALAATVRPHRSLAWALPGAALAAPWILRQLPHQLAYLGASASVEHGVPLLDHLLYYPRVLLADGLGPAWLAVVALAAWSGRGHLATRVGLAWLVGGIAVLTLVPRKYERLLVPALPGAGLVVAAGAGHPLVPLGALAGAAWTTWRSYGPPGRPPPAIARMQAGCPQVWLRPPVPDDLGLGAVVALLAEAPPGPVRVLAAPEIPCEVQTTFGWADHLGPALRRAGQDREVLRDGAPGTAVAVVDFRPRARGGRVIRIPRLGARAVVRLEGP